MPASIASVGVVREPGPVAGLSVARLGTTIEREASAWLQARSWCACCIPSILALLRPRIDTLLLPFPCRAGRARWRRPGRSPSPDPPLRLTGSSVPHRGFAYSDGILRCRGLRLLEHDERYHDRNDDEAQTDRKSTRLNSSHLGISYA